MKINSVCDNRKHCNLNHLTVATRQKNTAKRESERKRRRIQTHQTKKGIRNIGKRMKTQTRLNQMTNQRNQRNQRRRKRRNVTKTHQCWTALLIQVILTPSRRTHQNVRRRRRSIERKTIQRSHLHRTQSLRKRRKKRRNRRKNQQILNLMLSRSSKFRKR